MLYKIVESFFSVGGYCVAGAVVLGGNFKKSAFHHFGKILLDAEIIHKIFFQSELANLAV